MVDREGLSRTNSAQVSSSYCSGHSTGARSLEALRYGCPCWEAGAASEALDEACELDWTSLGVKKGKIILYAGSLAVFPSVSGPGSFQQANEVVLSGKSRLCFGYS